MRARPPRLRFPVRSAHFGPRWRARPRHPARVDLALLRRRCPPRTGFVPRHAKGAFKLTFAGVDLFFVLSGFLIGGILIRYRGTENFFQVFYARRFARLMPIYMAMIALYVVLSPRLPPMAPRPPAGCSTAIGRQFPPGLTCSICRTSPCAAIKDWGGEWLAVTWSLAIEEQFYLLAPLLAAAAPALPARDATRPHRTVADPAHRRPFRHRRPDGRVCAAALPLGRAVHRHADRDPDPRLWLRGAVARQPIDARRTCWGSHS